MTIFIVALAIGAFIGIRYISNVLDIRSNIIFDFISAMLFPISYAVIIFFFILKGLKR
jgi:hypothetical protein